MMIKLVKSVHDHDLVAYQEHQYAQGIVTINLHAYFVDHHKVIPIDLSMVASLKIILPRVSTLAMNMIPKSLCRIRAILGYPQVGNDDAPTCGRN